MATEKKKNEIVFDDGLIHYDSKYVISANGFTNYGATCYLNSLMQCFFSNPAVFQTLEKYAEDETIKKNALARELLRIYRLSKDGKNITGEMSKIWEIVLGLSAARSDRVKLTRGQQDAHEGFMLLMDVLEYVPHIQRLFQHRTQITLHCHECDKIVSVKEETHVAFDVQSDLKTEQHAKFKKVDKNYDKSMSLNEFIRSQNGFVDDDYICANAECKVKGVKFKNTRLVMIPEILVVLLKKYKKKEATPFPEQLYFIAKGGTHRMEFDLVAQSEHSGGQSGGHYWAICKRGDGKWYNLNDSGVSPSKPGPTKHSYMLFYNYARTVKLATPTKSPKVVYELAEHLKGTHVV